MSLSTINLDPGERLRGGVIDRDHRDSPLLCTPAVPSREDVVPALGTQAGPARIREVTVVAGTRPIPHRDEYAIQSWSLGADMTQHDYSSAGRWLLGRAS